MKLNQTLIMNAQGNKLLLDKDGYLVREDFQGNRQSYALGENSSSSETSAVNKIESIYPQTEYIDIPATSLDEIKDRYLVHLNSEYPWIQFPQFGNLPGDPSIQWTESMDPCERTFEIWFEDYYNFGLQTIDYGSVQIINPDSIDTTTGGIHVFTVRIAYVPDPGDSIMLYKTVTASYSYTFMN